MVMPNVAETSFKLVHMYNQLYPWKSSIELASHLCKNVIYNSGGLIAINKPFGVGLKNLTEEEISEKSKKPVNLLYSPGCTYSLEDTLPRMRKELNLPKLVIVKAAEKYNSGVTLLAENEGVANKLKKKLLTAKPLKIMPYHYYIVSTSIPPVGLRGEVHGEKVGVCLQKNPAHNFAQPVITREFSANSVKRGDTTLVSVEFSVKSSGLGNTSLVELSTNETKWNFIRIYCAYTLMPILGDHLYSQRVGLVQGLVTRLNPLATKPGSSHQKLSTEIQDALGLSRDKDSSRVPLHVHLHRMTIPNLLGKGKDAHVCAPVNRIFNWTCENLKLEIPKTDTDSLQDRFNTTNFRDQETI